MKFVMPFGGELDIRPKPSMTLDEELEIGSDEEVEGVIWQLFWNDLPLPWCTKTKLQATALAFGCQYGAMQGHNHPKARSRDEGD